MKLPNQIKKSNSIKMIKIQLNDLKKKKKKKRYFWELSDDWLHPYIDVVLFIKKKKKNSSIYRYIIY